MAKSRHQKHRKCIPKSRRNRIYERDSYSCIYCGHSMEDGASLTLDHIIPLCSGGSRLDTNLVTACLTCNRKRNTSSVACFLYHTGGFHHLYKILEKIHKIQRGK